MSETKLEVLAKTDKNLRIANNVLQALDLHELARDAKKLQEHIFCVLRNKTNPKYGGDPEWTGGPA